MCCYLQLHQVLVQLQAGEKEQDFSSAPIQVSISVQLWRLPGCHEFLAALGRKTLLTIVFLKLLQVSCLVAWMRFSLEIGLSGCCLVFTSLDVIPDCSVPLPVDRHGALLLTAWPVVRVGFFPYLGLVKGHCREETVLQK